VKTKRWVSLAGAAGAVIGLVAVVVPADAGESKSHGKAGAGGWQEVDTGGPATSPAGFDMVEETASGDVVAVDESNRAVRCWDGKQWSKVDRVPIPETPGRAIGSAGGVSCDNLYVFDHQDTPQRWHWDGTAWSHVPSGGKYAMDTIRAFAADDIWAASHISSGNAYHYDGTSWRKQKLPAMEVENLAGTSSKDLWALGKTTSSPSAPVAYHHNGTAWKKSTLPASFDGRAHEQVTVSAKDISVFGTTVKDGYLHWDGNAWRHEKLPVTEGYVHGAAAGKDTLWLGLYDTFLRRDADGQWRKEPFPQDDDLENLKIQDLATDHRTNTPFAGGAKWAGETPTLARMLQHNN
jgi:hypothetical protein